MIMAKHILKILLQPRKHCKWQARYPPSPLQTIRSIRIKPSIVKISGQSNPAVWFHALAVLAGPYLLTFFCLATLSVVSHARWRVAHRIHPLPSRQQLPLVKILTNYLQICSYIHWSHSFVKDSACARDGSLTFSIERCKSVYGTIGMGRSAASSAASCCADRHVALSPRSLTPPDV